MSALAGIALAALAAGDVAPIRYSVRFDPSAKTWDVTSVIPRAAGAATDFRFPRWTAGAYHLADYGRYVTAFDAKAADGSELAVERDGDDRFVVARGAGESVTLHWTARQCAPADLNERMILDVEGNRITDDYAFLSPNSLLGFVLGDQERPCKVALALPDGWKCATALPQLEDGEFAAPSWWRLEDSPFFCSPTQLTESFEVDGIPHSVTLFGSTVPDLAERVKVVASHCRKIVEAGRDAMQELPYPRYHFLLALIPGGGAGLEHSESTLICCDPELAATDEFDHLIAHEYFHCWCAERIHVAGLDHPDYTQPFRTGTIWVNEGITEYFSRHLLVRAGLQTREQFFDGLWHEAAQARALWPMTGDASWTDVSRAAPDWETMGDLLAFSVKHYQGGCWTILALDLEMRRRSAGERGIADLLRFLDRSRRRLGHGFAEDEIEADCEGLAQGDLGDFFRRCIDGPELPDLKQPLAVIGWTIKGGMGRPAPLAQPTADQDAALDDFFDLPVAERAILRGK